MVSARRATRPIVAIYPPTRTGSPESAQRRADAAARRVDGGRGSRGSRLAATRRGVPCTGCAARQRPRARRATAPERPEEGTRERARSAAGSTARGQEAPTTASKRHAPSPEVRRVAARRRLWPGWSACSSRVAASSRLYQTIDIPDPNEDFETQTSFVYYNDGKTELGRSPPRTASHPARRDAADDQGRRGRRREPHLLDRPGHRPQGHPARGLQQRRRATPPRARRRSPSSTSRSSTSPRSASSPARSRRRSSRSSCSGR